MTTKHRVLAVDWVTVIGDIVDHLQSWTKIEAYIGVDKNTLRGYYEGVSQPIHWRGELIVRAWCSLTRSDRASLPLTEVYIAPRIVTSGAPVFARVKKVA